MRRGVSALAIITAVSGVASASWAQEAAQQVEDVIVTGQRGAIASARADERRADVIQDLDGQRGEAAAGAVRRALHEQDDVVLGHGLGDEAVDGIGGGIESLVGHGERRLSLQGVS